MADASPHKQHEERNPMFEAGSGMAKGFIEAILCKCIGVERNAKINAKSSVKKKK